MRWTISDIETFLAVLDAGSISAAAVRANLSKSVVSKRISDFETTLGVPLFARHAGRIAPTDNAIALAERLRPALAELIAATESATHCATGLRGRLSITAPMSFGIRHLGRVVTDFAAAHPELEIVLDYNDQMTDLMRHGFDVAIRIGALDDSTLLARKLCEDARILVASPDYLARTGPLDRTGDLPRFEVIGYLNTRMSKIWSFDAGTPLPRPGRVLANNGEAMRDMAVGGIGLAYLPMFIVADDLATGKLVEVLPELKRPILPISVVWPPIKPMQNKVRVFVDHLIGAFSAGPPWLADKSDR